MKADFQQMGVAALIPGAQWLLERMQRELDELREMLSELQAGAAPRRGHPPKDGFNARGKPLAKKGLWASMTAEERSAEMRRRALVAQGKAPSVQTGWRGRQYQKERAARPSGPANWWATATPAQKRKRLAAMEAGKKKKANGSAEVLQ